MTEPIITVEGLAKAYRIGAREAACDTAVGALSQTLRAPWRNLRRLQRLSGIRVEDESPDILWALRDVSFDVAEGEVVGIVGRNGAGKSTLLKVLSRITAPTAGVATIRGRVASLLEVGTGFHPELTGRENVYMNGTILGMTKREIDRKFDEIVDFSGVERFLDTPTKRYSSGMQVRLAFAVAAHLEPEVLIIDEVLAVGDAEFQRRCLGKMRDVATSGRTVLFVSHNMSAIESLCTTAIEVRGGRLAERGEVGRVVERYHEHLRGGGGDADRATPDAAAITRVTVAPTGDNPTATLRSGDDLEVRLAIRTEEPLERCRIGLRIDALTGARLLLLQSEIATGELIDLPGEGRVVCRLPRLPLQPGVYQLVIALTSRGRMVDHLEPACEFTVESGDFFGTGRLPQPSLSSFLARSDWELLGPTARPEEATLGVPLPGEAPA